MSYRRAREPSLGNRVLSSYIGHYIRVYVKENPLLNHPPIYEGVLSAIFENPPALMLEDAETLILDYVPLRDYFRIVRKERVGAVFIKLDELNFFELFEKEPQLESLIPKDIKNTYEK